MKIQAAEFIKSCVTPDQYPKERLPEVALVGRSNVGKSSAINCLMNQKGLAKVGKVPGKTQTVNFFRITTSETKIQRFYLVDLPGYGYAKVPKAIQQQWKPMIEGYLTSREQLCGALVFVDVRGEERSDGEMIQWLESVNCPTAIVVTKVDKISRGKRHGYMQHIQKRLPLYPNTSLLPFSAKTIEGKAEIFRILKHFIEGEGSNRPTGLRACALKTSST